MVMIALGHPSHATNRITTAVHHRIAVKIFTKSTQIASIRVVYITQEAVFVKYIRLLLEEKVDNTYLSIFLL